MSEISQSSINESVIIKDGNVLTSSLSVAYVFNKKPKNIMKEIRAIRKRGIESGVAHNISHPEKRYYCRFETYTHPQNHQIYKKALINRRVFLHLVMGFRGQKAFEFKDMFIDAFDNMDYQLRHMKPPMNKLNERNQKLLQNKVDTLEPENHQLKHKQWYIDQTVQSIKPKADAYDQEMTSKYVYPLSHLAERYGTDATHMNLVLQKIGVIGKRAGRWYLTKNFDERYASHDISYVGEHGSSTDSGALKWTQRGFQLIRTLLKLHYNVTELHQNGNDFNMKFLMYQEHHKYKITEVNRKQLKQLNLI